MSSGVHLPVLHWTHRVLHSCSFQALCLVVASSLDRDATRLCERQRSDQTCAKRDAGRTQYGTGDPWAPPPPTTHCSGVLSTTSNCDVPCATCSGTQHTAQPACSAVSRSEPDSGTWSCFIFNINRQFSAVIENWIRYIAFFGTYVVVAGLHWYKQIAEEIFHKIHCQQERSFWQLENVERNISACFTLYASCVSCVSRDPDASRVEQACASHTLYTTCFHC